jgi:hypothetical protein
MLRVTLRHLDCWANLGSPPVWDPSRTRYNVRSSMSTSCCPTHVASIRDWIQSWQYTREIPNHCVAINIYGVYSIYSFIFVVNSEAFSYSLEFNFLSYKTRFRNRIRRQVIKFQFRGVMAKHRIQSSGKERTMKLDLLAT